MNIENWLLHRGISPKVANQLISHLPSEQVDESYLDFFTAEYIMKNNDENIPEHQGYIEIGSGLDGTTIALDVRSNSGEIHYLPITCLETIDYDPRLVAVKVAESPDDFVKRSVNAGFPPGHWDAIELLPEKEAKRISNQIFYGSDEKPQDEEKDQDKITLTDDLIDPFA